MQLLLLGLGISSVLYPNRRTEHLQLLPDGHGGVKEYACRAQHELAVARTDLGIYESIVGFFIVGKADRLRAILSEYRRGPCAARAFATVSEVIAEGEEEVFDLSEPVTRHFFANGLLVHNCGEVPLLPFEACNLASINVAHFVDGADVAWPRLRDTIRLAVRFLDDVIDANRYPKPQIEAIVKGNRKIGLGVMGWADLLFRLSLRYDSEAALALARKLMTFVKEEGWLASMDLAAERGPFPNHARSVYAEKDHPLFSDGFRARRGPMRNATVTCVAPTGTISIIAGCTSGIEPAFSLAFTRHVLDGATLPEVNPFFEAVAKREGFWSEELVERLAAGESPLTDDAIPARWREVFVRAHDIAPEGHLRMQAAFQEFTDNAVSKTVNFPQASTPDDVRRVYDLAVQLGVKGVTVYRDKSRTGQPMALEAVACREC